MRKIKRAVHFDFHTMPGIDDFGKDFCASEFAERLSNCHVDYINMFARCNIGFSYYPTKIGFVYPHMKGNLLGDIIEECHKRGIGVSAYLNGGLNHQLTIEKPGIMKINKDGTVYKPNRVTANFFRSPCYNNPEYRAHLIGEIKEILELGPDGIFCDCLMPFSCYCPTCIKKMREKGIDINDDKQVFAFALDSLRDLFCDIRNAVPRDKRLILNSHPYDDLYQHQSHVEIECLPTDPNWGYDFLPAMAPYYRKLLDELIYMNGRFVKSWGDFGGVKSRAAIENDVFDALFYGYVPSIGDHLHPRYGLDNELYNNVKEIYEYVMSLEPWTDNTKPITEAAIIRNKTNYDNVRDFAPDTMRGCARMLSELKISYDVVNEEMDFADYKLLVLPGNVVINEKLRQKLEDFKGSILSTGKSISDSKVWDYISEYSENNDTHGFFSWGDDVRAQYIPGIKMKSDYSITDSVEPYFNQEFDWLQSYFYVPYRESKGFSAVAMKDNRAHICFDVFGAYITYGTIFHKDLVESVINKLLPERIIGKGTLPSSARACLMNGEKGDVLHIKVTHPEYRGRIGVIEEHNVLKEGAKVYVKGKYTECYALPDMKNVTCVYADGKTEITLPEICGYQPFLLK